ncbi:MAG: heme exporter protein CcmD [Parasphingorhabdus sp.]|jgi:heme exporter protein CcmD
MSDFFAMGGYAWYVWPAYLLTLVVIVGNVIAAKTLLKQTKKQLLGKIRLAERKTK